MGSCLSASYSDETVNALATAKVVTMDGSLQEYSVPTKVSDILVEKRHTSAFLCSSDELYLDRDIPSMRSHDSVVIGQIYFILPQSMLDRPLKGQDMAALAVKASLALAGALDKGLGSTGSKRGIKVMPVHDMDEELEQTYKISSGLPKSEKTRNRVPLRRSGKHLAGRAPERGHKTARLAVIDEVAE